MKKWLSILALFIGVGSVVSAGKKADSIDPFERYIAKTKLKTFDPALTQFATQCGLDLNTARPVYASRPDNNWVVVNDLKLSLDGIETDFFATSEVRKSKDRILVEQWWMELDTADESRDLYCFKNSRLLYAQTVFWSLPQAEEGNSPSALWGYEQNWKPTGNGLLKLLNRRFIDGNGRNISTPQLNGKPADKANWPSPTVRKLEDLELPENMLR